MQHRERERVIHIVTHIGVENNRTRSKTKISDYASQYQNPEHV
jgi:hypothetical protein